MCSSMSPTASTHYLNSLYCNTLFALNFSTTNNKINMIGSFSNAENRYLQYYPFNNMTRY